MIFKETINDMFKVLLKLFICFFYFSFRISTKKFEVDENCGERCCLPFSNMEIKAETE